MKTIGILMSLMIGVSALANNTGGGTVGSDVLQKTNYLCGHVMNAIEPLGKETPEGHQWTTFTRDFKVVFDAKTSRMKLTPVMYITTQVFLGANGSLSEMRKSFDAGQMKVETTLATKSEAKQIARYYGESMKERTFTLRQQSAEDLESAQAHAREEAEKLHAKYNKPIRDADLIVGVYDVLQGNDDVGYATIYADGSMSINSDVRSLIPFTVSSYSGVSGEECTRSPSIK